MQEEDRKQERGKLVGQESLKKRKTCDRGERGAGGGRGRERNMKKREEGNRS